MAALGMVSTGIVQLVHLQEEVDTTSLSLGYPIYFLTIVGACKLLGVVTLLIPKTPLLKEWAYAGFCFLMSGAIVSHWVVGDAPKEFFGPALLLVLTIASWYFRPADRRLNFTNKQIL